MPGLRRSRAAGALAAPRTATTSLTVPVHSAPARPAAHSPLLLIAAVAGALLLAGSLLVYITRRRPRHAARPPFPLPLPLPNVSCSMSSPAFLKAPGWSRMSRFRSRPRNQRNRPPG